MTEDKDTRIQPCHVTRREFGRLTAAGMLSGGMMLSDTARAATSNETDVRWNIEPGIKIHLGHIRPTVSDEDLEFVRQLGVEYVEFYIPHEVSFYEDLVKLRDRVESMGLKIFNVGYDADNHWYNLTDRIQLGLPGRDEDIESYRRFLRDASRAGIHTVCYGFYTKVGQRTGSVLDRGASVSAFDQSKVAQDLFHGRVFGEEEMWDNYTYFLDRILPVAEDTGVRLALHPNDPPAPVMRGVPQIFRDNRSYERMVDIANGSPYAGVEFCVGTWGTMAGPDGKAEDVIGAIRQFGDRIYTVHFRNVSGPVPVFNETFLETGFLDMHEVLKTLNEVGFRGSMEPDHVPSFSDEKRFTNKSVVGTAYSIAYMRALLERVNAEG